MVAMQTMSLEYACKNVLICLMEILQPAIVLGIVQIDGMHTLLPIYAFNTVHPHILQITQLGDVS